MFLDKLEQGVKVTCLSVLLLLLPILKEDQCWVAMDTMMAAEVPLHGAVHLECVLFRFLEERKCCGSIIAGKHL